MTRYPQPGDFITNVSARRGGDGVNAPRVGCMGRGGDGFNAPGHSNRAGVGMNESVETRMQAANAPIPIPTFPLKGKELSEFPACAGSRPSRPSGPSRRKTVTRDDRDGAGARDEMKLVLSSFLFPLSYSRHLVTRHGSTRHASRASPVTASPVTRHRFTCHRSTRHASRFTRHGLTRHASPVHPSRVTAPPVTRHGSTRHPSPPHPSRVTASPVTRHGFTRHASRASPVTASPVTRHGFPRHRFTRPSPPATSATPQYSPAW
jgi:hypothetical protein